MTVKKDFEKLCINNDINNDDNVLPVKSLVFKPKTPKSQEPIPIVVIALQTTTTPGNLLAKLTNTKDPRLARDDLVTSFFNSDSAKDFNLSHLLNAKSEFHLLIDQNLINVNKSSILKLNDTLFINIDNLLNFIDTIKFHNKQIVDFSQIPTPDENKKNNNNKQQPKKEKNHNNNNSVIEDAKLIGITVDKSLDFPGWYQQVLTKGEMLDYYDVSGCYILRPSAQSIWEEIQHYFDKKIKKMGVRTAYFPMFVSSKVLEKEKDHVEGFAPEVAWVTKAGQSDLEEPIAIRPTSETVIYPYYAKWVQSHRDLPLKLNQWCSVVRWEFKHPQPFLRTREFLWQEGHTAFLESKEAEDEVLEILGHYANIYKELLAIPVVQGRKTEKEKFAGAVFTTTVEGYIPQTGRAIQGGTSHHLGQNFSKMFNLSVENPLGANHPKIFAYQNSWGISTRSIGVMVMTHSDNKGLVIPPRVAERQVVIIPVGITKKTTIDEKNKIFDTCKKIEKQLYEKDIRIFGDYNDNYTPGWKFSQYELKGIPLRIEIGPKDISKNQMVVVCRDDSSKHIISINDDKLDLDILNIMEKMHDRMYNKAKESYDSHRLQIEDWKDFVPLLNKKNVLVVPWCGKMECEEDIKESSSRNNDGDEFEEVDEKAPSMGAKSLCTPFDQPELKKGTKCIKCGDIAVNYTMFGRSY